MKSNGEVYPNKNASMRFIGKRHCPDEADILAYSENLLSGRRRARVEGHMAECHHCREVVTLLARGDLVTDADPVSESPDDVRIQTAAVLEMIAQDERRIDASGPRQEASGWLDWLIQFRPQVAAPVTALLLLVVAGSVALYLSRDDSATDAAMKTLATAVAMDGRRRTDVRLSADLPYYRYSETRGLENSKGDFYFYSALNQAKVAEAEVGATQEVRLAQARIYLARAHNSDVKEALKILQELIDNGADSGAVFNELGVAKYQDRDYKGAVEAFSEALTRSPNMAEALFNRGIARKRLAVTAREIELQSQLREEARGDFERFSTLSVDEEWKNEAATHLRNIAAESNR